MFNVTNNNPEKEKVKISTLLSEFEECQRIMHYYDSRRWASGAVVVLMSLGILFFSLNIEFIKIILSAIFSIGFIIIWYGYAHEINPHIMSSLARSFEIKQELRKMDSDEKSVTLLLQNNIGTIKGMKIVKWTFSLIVLLWIFLISKRLSEQSLSYSTMVLIASVVALYIFTKWFDKYNFEKYPFYFTEEIKQIENERK